MAPRYVSLTSLISIFLNDRVLPVTLMLAECGRGSILLQSPVTYKVERYQYKRSFEFVKHKDLPVFLLDIVAIATNGKPLLKQSFSHSLIYSTRKAFLKKAVVGLVYKFDEKSYRECLKK